MNEITILYQSIDINRRERNLQRIQQRCRMKQEAHRVHSLEFMKDRKQGLHYGVPGRRQQSIAIAQVQSH